MDYNSPPTPVGTSLTLRGSWTTSRGGGKAWDSKDWIQPTRFDTLGLFYSHRDNYGLCWVIW